MGESIYRVYVVELSDDYAPRHNPEFPWVYVGQSSLSPEERFEHHKSGGRYCSPAVRDHGLHLRPELFEALPVFTRQADAEREERQQAERLRVHGYSVHCDGRWPAIGQVMGECPSCGGDVRVTSRGYACDGADSRCDFSFRNHKAGRILPANAVRELLRDGSTKNAVTRFRESSGRKFSARLELAQQSDGRWQIRLLRASSARRVP